MTTIMASPEGLLKAITQYTPNVRMGDVKAFQWVYFLDDLAQAQRVVQILNALSLIARAYPNPDGSGAKIYFQFNEKTPLDKKLALAPSYFSLLREFADAMDRHTPHLDCKHSLHVASPDGNSILFYIKIEPIAPRQDQEVDDDGKASGNADVSAPLAPSSPAVPSAYAAAQEIAEDSTKKPDRPSVFQKKNTATQDAESKKMTKVGEALGSRVATHTATIVKVFGIGFAILVLFMMSRGFLCPDFAHARTAGPVPWYCSK